MAGIFQLNLRLCWLFQCHIQPLKAETIPSRSLDQCLLVYHFHLTRSPEQDSYFRNLGAVSLLAWVARSRQPRSRTAAASVLLGQISDMPRSRAASSSLSAFLSDGGASSSSSSISIAMSLPTNWIIRALAKGRMLIYRRCLSLLDQSSFKINFLKTSSFSLQVIH